MFAILFERDWPILGDNKLRSILECFEPSGDAPKTRLEFFPLVERLTPNFQRERAGSVARTRIAKSFALLRALFAD